MSHDLNAKIKLLVKSEKALLSLEMRKKSRQMIWVSMGVLAILVCLIMINFTLYFYLETRYNNFQSASILSALNLITALIFFLIASKQNTGTEAESIEEIRDFAWSQLSTDIDEAKHNVAEFTHSVIKVKNNVNSFAKGDVFGFKKILPIITTLIEMNKKGKAKL